MPRYMLFAGVNGAGKSTLYQTNAYDQSIHRINVDEIVRSFGDWRNPRDVAKAGRIAVAALKNHFAERTSVNQETTLCGQSILRHIRYAKSIGYRIELSFVGVDSVETARQRVRMRVAAGGHDIPDADIERRFSESLQHLLEILPACDVATIYDNTIKLSKIAIYKHGKQAFLAADAPEWFMTLIWR